MIGVLIGVAVFFGILLMIIILAQNPKGGGLSSAFGGSGTSQMIGVKKTTDLLERITWVLISVVFALSLSTSLLIPRGTLNDGSTEAERRAREAQQAAPAAGPSVFDAAEGDQAPEGEGGAESIEDLTTDPGQPAEEE